ncbi:MAG: NADH-quinone oxidoreductase subunit I, partial [Mesorhizobium sp.]
MSRALHISGTWIGWAFFADLAGALALTFGYMFSRSVTMQYPDKEKWLPYSRYRGHHFLTRDEEGE